MVQHPDLWVKVKQLEMCVLIYAFAYNYYTILIKIWMVYFRGLIFFSEMLITQNCFIGTFHSYILLVIFLKELEVKFKVNVSWVMEERAISRNTHTVWETPDG